MEETSDIIIVDSPYLFCVNTIENGIDCIKKAIRGYEKFYNEKTLLLSTIKRKNETVCKYSLLQKLGVENLNQINMITNIYTIVALSYENISVNYEIGASKNMKRDIEILKEKILEIKNEVEMLKNKQLGLNQMIMDINH